MKVRVEALRHAYWNIRHWDLAFAWRLVRTIRLADVISCLWLFPIRQPGRPAETRLTLRAGCSVTLRTYSSDPEVFRQVFVEAQYDLPIELKDVTRIIDAGANIGLSSVFYLLRYPSATVIALEPDPVNHTMACANTSSFGPRCRVLQAALWSHDASLSLLAGDAAWSGQVAPATPSTGTVLGLPLRRVMDDAGWSTVDVVKLDIEGAELEVLEGQDVDSVSTSRCWAIELHSEAARKAFDRLFSGTAWRVGRHGEIDFAWRSLS